jgi:long-chain acyl-CoA synthetase
METLVDLIPEIRRLDRRESLRFYNGFRTWTLSYRQLYHRIGGFVRFLDRHGFQKGDRLLLWGENRPEWVVVFWGCLARGVAVVPVDFRSSAHLVERIQTEVGARQLVHGALVRPDELDLEIPTLSFERFDNGETEDFELTPVSPDDVVQIVFTSGTTGEPKGVVHRHHHICANLEPFRCEIDKYKKLALPFQPIRILDLLPLSHLFGQSLGVFFPILLGGAAVFMEELHPSAVIETIHRERVSVLVGVPRHLTNLRNEIERRFESPQAGTTAKGVWGAVRSWWRHRSIHAAFGWKFWALVVGGARLSPEEEEFWRALGFVLVQGYGLTEASPVVATNHPFHPRPGSLGKPLPGQEIKIAPDGEILVRGKAVVSSEMSADGWLHTGDLGYIDAEGRLYYQGRKKDVIVTAEGLNVYPQDVESALNERPEVRESVVIGVSRTEEEQVHAVLLLADPQADVESVIRAANTDLETHQRIRSWSTWPFEDFPRTPSTWKVKRGEVKNRVLAMEPDREAQVGATQEASTLTRILTEMTGRKAAGVEEGSRLSEDLGLSSLEQVDLLSRIEEGYGVELDEATFAEMETVGQLRQWLHSSRDSAPAPTPVSEATPLRELPRWSRLLPIRWARTALSQTLFWPLLHHYIELSVEGLEHLDGLKPPVLFAANHNSHLDTPIVLAALPFAWRTRVAPAARQEYFRGKAFQYYLACGLFNVYPLPQQVVGVRRALKFTGELVDDGYCPLVYPEGERSPDGTLQPFQTGIGMLAVRLRTPVVPIYIKGMFEIFSMYDSWPRTGAVRVRVGSALHFREAADYREATETLRRAIVDLGRD